MGAAASAISQQDLTNEEKTVITKVGEKHVSMSLSFYAFQFGMSEICHIRRFI